jgi:hypothetical protein
MHNKKISFIYRNHNIVEYSKIKYNILIFYAFLVLIKIY